MGGSPSFPLSPLPRERLYVVTGGNTGIGYETAKWIAMLGARVIIACRSEERAIVAIERMNAEFAAEKKRGTQGICDDDTLAVEFMKLDCSSLSSTQEFIDNFLSKENTLHVLICNAGIGIHQQEYSEDGYELMFQVNYLSHFLITVKLLPVMKNSGDDCRIIMTSSVAHEYGEFDLDTIQGKHFTKQNFPRFRYYGNSKLYQIMQMYSMNRRLQNTNIVVTSLHPGFVNTEITRNFTDTMWSTLFKAAKCCGVSKTPYEGAITSINTAVNPSLAGLRDRYFVDCKLKQTHTKARNKDNQEKLWNYTLKCLQPYICKDDLQLLLNE